MPSETHSSPKIPATQMQKYLLLPTNVERRPTSAPDVLVMVQSHHLFPRSMRTISHGVIKSKSTNSGTSELIVALVSRPVRLCPRRHTPQRSLVSKDVSGPTALHPVRRKYERMHLHRVVSVHWVRLQTICHDIRLCYHQLPLPASVAGRRCQRACVRMRMHLSVRCVLIDTISPLTTPAFGLSVSCVV